MATKKPSKAGDSAKIEVTRTRFRSLIGANPNYFGNAQASGFTLVKKIASNTTYEEVTSVGYNPHIKRLFATLDVKKSFGYSGDLCDDGSTEYVRFFVDFGSGWVDAGVVATDVHDIPGGKDCANKTQHPLTYSLELPYSPARKWCTSPQLPQVRAILSWNVEPPAGNANWTPVYGNVIDCAIQIDKSWWFKHFLDDLVAEVKIPIDLLESVLPTLPPELPEIPDLPEPPFPGPDPSPLTAAKALSLAELMETYSTPTRGKARKLTVEPSRFAFAELQAITASPGLDISNISAVKAILDAGKIDISDLVLEIEDTTGNISYEELVDIGLDYNREKLDATYHVKKSTGFSGGLCTTGSTEYVAFWADWNDTCEWEYLDTVEVKAYDFERLPDGGLCYTASLPVDLTDIKEKCEDPKVARVRAVLSWNAPPSTTNPDLVPTWGNRLDAHVLVPRLEGAPGQLTIVGGVATFYISDVDGLTVPGAKFVDSGNDVDSLGRSCPFGGLIIVRGPAVDGKRYRIQVIDSGGASQTLTEKIWVTPKIGPGDYHHGTVDGWFDYLDYDDNFEQVLGYYRSSGDGLVTIQLEIEGDGVVDSQIVQLDNTWPDVAISITAPGGDCDLMAPGVLLEGLVEAEDLYMGSWSVVIDGGPGGFGPVPVTTGGSGTISTPAGGSVWTFDTTGLVQCGYVVRVTATDRAIVGSGPSHHKRSTDVGFCIIE